MLFLGLALSAPLKLLRGHVLVPAKLLKGLVSHVLLLTRPEADFLLPFKGGFKDDLAVEAILPSRSVDRVVWRPEYMSYSTTI